MLLAGRRCIVGALLTLLAVSSIDGAHAVDEGRTLATTNLDISTFSRAINACTAQDNECGPTKGACVTGECCSQFGFCGTEGAQSSNVQCPTHYAPRTYKYTKQLEGRTCTASLFIIYQCSCVHQIIYSSFGLLNRLLSIT